MKANIGFDLDGVLCDLYPDAFKVLKELYPDKVTSNNVESKWDKEFNLSEQQIQNCFIEVARKGMLRTAKIYPGAKEVLYKLDRLYNIYFISWRNYIPNAREDTLYWLDSNKIPYEKLILTNNKYKIATQEKFCFYADDNVQQCNRIAKTNVPTFLFMRPWNKDDPIDALVKGVRSWKEIEKIINY